MTTLDILNLQVNAKYLKGLIEMSQYWNHPFISIGEIVKLCAPRIEKRQERFEKLQSLAELRPIWNLKELSERLSTSRQTLYNWKEEGWLVVNSAGKADLKATVKLWKELQWHI